MFQDEAAKFRMPYVHGTLEGSFILQKELMKFSHTFFPGILVSDSNWPLVLLEPSFVEKCDDICCWSQITRKDIFIGVRGAYNVFQLLIILNSLH